MNEYVAGEQSPSHIRPKLLSGESLNAEDFAIVALAFVIAG
jgi:hypothetical protein